MNSSFTLEKGIGEGIPRAGILSLPNGKVPTPVFMPVGTQATVKGTLPRDLHEVVQMPYHSWQHLSFKFTPWGRDCSSGRRALQIYELEWPCSY